MCNLFLFLVYLYFNLFYFCSSLIRKYYAKNEQFEQTEVLLLAAKEECKQVCIDYKETLEKCTQVEKVNIFNN